MMAMGGAKGENESQQMAWEMFAIEKKRLKWDIIWGNHFSQKYICKYYNNNMYKMNF